MSAGACLCRGYVYLDCPVHGDGLNGCTCQYRGVTPKWYITVKTCPIHAGEYDPLAAPEWAYTQTDCGAETQRDAAGAAAAAALSGGETDE